MAWLKGHRVGQRQGRGRKIHPGQMCEDGAKDTAPAWTLRGLGFKTLQYHEGKEGWQELEKWLCGEAFGPEFESPAAM